MAVGAELFRSWGSRAELAACQVGGRRPGVARRASNFLSRRRKKVTKERTTPLSASPALRAGATCGARGRGAPQNSLRAGALRSNNCGELDHEACVSCGTHATPPSALLGAYRGAWGANIHSGHCVAALRSAPNAQALRAATARPSEAKARVAVRLSGCSAVQPLLAAPAAGRLRGEHARRSAHASLSSSPQLSERSCKAAQ